MAAIDKIERLIKVLEISQEMEVFGRSARIGRTKFIQALDNQTASESPSGTCRLPIEHVPKVLDIRLLPQCSQPV